MNSANLKELLGDNPDTIKQATQIWQQLDALSLKDPSVIISITQAYKQFIRQAKTNAEKDIIEKRLVKPCKSGSGLDSRGLKVVLNICRSNAVTKPTVGDPLNIPILVSNERKSNDVLVYDAVFHEDTIGKCEADMGFSKDVLGLACGCIDELFKVKIVESSLVFKNEYFGTYGWDDRTGKPLESTIEAPKKEVVKPSVIIRAPEEETIPEISLSKPVSTQKLMIEVVQNVPDYTVIDKAECYEVIVILPYVESSLDVDLTIEGQVVNISNSDYKLEIAMNFDANMDLIKARFSKARLKLKIPKLENH